MPGDLFALLLVALINKFLLFFTLFVLTPFKSNEKFPDDDNNKFLSLSTCSDDSDGFGELLRVSK